MLMNTSLIWTPSAPLPDAIPCPIKLCEGVTTCLRGGEFNQSIYN